MKIASQSPLVRTQSQSPVCETTITTSRLCRQHHNYIPLQFRATTMATSDSKPDEPPPGSTDPGIQTTRHSIPPSLLPVSSAFPLQPRSISSAISTLTVKRTNLRILPLQFRQAVAVETSDGAPAKRINHQLADFMRIITSRVIFQTFFCAVIPKRYRQEQINLRPNFAGSGSWDCNIFPSLRSCYQFSHRFFSPSGIPITPAGQTC